MASFYGTSDDVNRFLMPRIRNVVQTLSRPLKGRSGGACEHCGRAGVTLEAAHVHGRGRKEIVHEVLEGYRFGGGFCIDDLDAFEGEVVAAHEPLGETFLFLCRDCHRAYDGQTPSEALPDEGGRRNDSANDGARANAGRRLPRSTGGDLAERFYDYLVDEGYTATTPSGNPGTAYSYKTAVGRVCNWEGCGWGDLPGLIDSLIFDYSEGSKADRGCQSRGTVRNALKAFGRFCDNETCAIGNGQRGRA